jgi:phenylacetate-CoA ligase
MVIPVLLFYLLNFYKEKYCLTTICPTLKVCMVTSEMLFEDDKMLLEKQFGIPVVNEYGASELDLIVSKSSRRMASKL